ncbi:hypothetical protein C0993_007077, partial [Termitomyces sp. T159_Od127]
LHTLVDEIHTSSNPQHFENPVDPACLFHVQYKEPIKVQNSILALVPHQQEELNAAFNILKAFNPSKGLFDQLTACTIGLLAHFYANSVFSTFHTWKQLVKAESCSDALLRLISTNNDNAFIHTLFHINKFKAFNSGSASSEQNLSSRAST